VFRYCGNSDNFVFGINEKSSNNSIRSRALATNSIKLVEDVGVTTQPPVISDQEFLLEQDKEALKQVSHCIIIYLFISTFLF